MAYRASYGGFSPPRSSKLMDRYEKGRSSSPQNSRETSDVESEYEETKTDNCYVHTITSPQKKVRHIMYEHSDDGAQGIDVEKFTTSKDTYFKKGSIIYIANDENKDKDDPYLGPLAIQCARVNGDINELYLKSEKLLSEHSLLNEKQSLPLKEKLVSLFKLLNNIFLGATLVIAFPIAVIHVLVAVITDLICFAINKFLQYVALYSCKAFL